MADRPHIVFITTHDTGRHFGCYGIDQLNTPHVDRLAADGVLLENFFCATPVCSPSRGAMMSGLYPQTNGMLGLVHPPTSWTYDDHVEHLSKRLRDIGYHTALFHHQHEVMPDRIADRLSFDEYLVPQQTKPTPEQIGQAFADFAAGYDGDEPFYAQIGFGLTHTPWDVQGTPPDDEKGVYVPPRLIDNDAAREHLAPLQGAVKRLDGAVGLIMDGLEKAGLADETIFIFTVDHGLELPQAKWTLFDPGIEVAFIIRCPKLGLTGGRRCPQLLSNVDVTPTLLELIGEPMSDEMDGRSFVEALRDPDHAPGREAVYAMFNGGGQYPEARCVRTERYKFIRNFSNHRLLETPIDIANPRKAVDRINAERDNAFCAVTQLYDLEADPLEFENLVGKPDYAEVEAELDAKLWRWLEDVDDPILQGPIAPVTYRRSIADYAKYKGG